MEDVQDAFAFLIILQNEIKLKDKLHYKKIHMATKQLKESSPDFYRELLDIIKTYFTKENLSSQEIISDYLKMINDMRSESIYFFKNNKYRCESQAEANNLVYSKPEVMKYYMNALLISQVLWVHHFNTYLFFKKTLQDIFSENHKYSVLDVGPGHGLFSFIIKSNVKKIMKLDIVDVSLTSLEMTKSIVGYDDIINYYETDIFFFNKPGKYDLIILGEILEHLDDPKLILTKLKKHLKVKGFLWITTPTNSPALDHVYLFKTKSEVLSLIEETGLVIVSSYSTFAEEVDEKIALKYKVTNLVSVLCKL